MPLHRFFSPKGLYTREDTIAAAVTDVYTKINIPAFYVVVLFIEVEPDNYFVGGKRTGRFLRIGIEHIARNFSDDKGKRNVLVDRYEKALAPFTAERGINWEVQVTDRVLWNGNVSPPLPNTEEERIWKRANRAVPVEGMEMLKRAAQM
ncbi:putative oxalocrotonate tautomerase [Mycena filopes]|nr:putative oxalocrotonate tautomerase [Mycena filopes]